MRIDERRHGRRHLGQDQRLHRVDGGRLASLRVGDQDDAAAARGDLLHVGHGLLEDAVVRRDHDHRHVLVDQRDRAVLQLAGGIALGVDVGDFLELQRAFERQRIAGAAAEIEDVVDRAPESAASASICGSRRSASLIRRGTSLSARTSFASSVGGQMAAGACPRQPPARRAPRAGR